MTGFIPENVVNQIRDHFDIFDIVSQHVHLKKKGCNFFGLCPFHSEKTPSFSVNTNKQIFHCFGCGTGGDVFTFLMNLDNLTFVEAARELANRAGIDIPDQAGRHEDRKKVTQKNRLLSAMDLAAKLYRYILSNGGSHGQEARDYLATRSFSTEVQAEFRIGFAPASWDALFRFMKRRGFKEPLLEEAGLITARSDRSGHFDRFRHRIMFPIEDTQGRVIGFGGRVLGDGTPKYLNSPETPLFNKSRILYNLHRARKAIRQERVAILFEGYVDVVTAWQAEIHNVVASMGTSLTETQARILRRNTETVVVCFDADAAGEEAAIRGLDILKTQGCRVRVAEMPIDYDPDDYIKKYGGEAFLQNIIAAALPLTAFKLQNLQKGLDLTDEDQKMKYVQRALEVITDLPAAVERDHYMRQLSQQCNLSLDAVKTEQRQLFYRRKKREKQGDKQRDRWNTDKKSKHMIAEQSLQPAHHNAERKLIALMMRNQQLASRVQTEVGSMFNVAYCAAIAAYLYAYYAEGHPADEGAFVRYLPDQSLKETASGLAMTELSNEVSEQEIEDYIQQVRTYPILLEIEEKKRQVRQAEQVGNAVEAVRIGQDLIRLKQQVKLRKEGI